MANSVRQRATKAATATKDTSNTTTTTTTTTTTPSGYQPTAYGKEIDKKLDNHHEWVRVVPEMWYTPHIYYSDAHSSFILSHISWEFGGPVGVTAMMLGFPALMC